VALGQIYLRELQFSRAYHHSRMFYTHPPPSDSPDRIQHYIFLALSARCFVYLSQHLANQSWGISIRFYLSASHPASQHEHRNTQSLSRRLDMEQVYLSRFIGLPTSLMPGKSGFDSWQEQAKFSLQRTVMHTHSFVSSMC